jgi:protein TonB
MNTLPSYLDILFEHRNKLYGAYRLRQEYGSRARNAFLISSSIFWFAILIPFLYGIYHHGPLPVKPPLKPYELSPLNMPVNLPKAPVVPQPPAGPTPPPDVFRIVPDDMVLPVVPPVVAPPRVAPGEGGGQAPGLGGTPGGGGPGGGSPNGGGIDAPPNPPKVYDMLSIAQYPEFPGGEEALMRFLQNNIKYPDMARKQDVQGRVVIRFIVDSEGHINEVKLFRGIGFGCDEEAVRVVKMMPAWKPGRNDGKPVSVYFDLPIHFSLE